MRYTIELCRGINNNGENITRHSRNKTSKECDYETIAKEADIYARSLGFSNPRTKWYWCGSFWKTQWASDGEMHAIKLVPAFIPQTYPMKIVL